MLNFFHCDLGQIIYGLCDFYRGDLSEITTMQMFNFPLNFKVCRLIMHSILRCEQNKVVKDHFCILIEFEAGRNIVFVMYGFVFLSIFRYNVLQNYMSTLIYCGTQLTKHLRTILIFH